MKNVFQTALIVSSLTALVACPTAPPTNPPTNAGAGYKVVGEFTMSDVPVCLYGIANLSDHIEFNLKPAGADFTLEAIQNQASKNENFRGQIAGAVVTQDSQSEVMNLTEGQGKANSLNVVVTLTGTSTASSCTLVYPQQPPLTDVGGPAGAASGFSFKTDAFVNNTQNVTNGNWVFTITKP